MIEINLLPEYLKAEPEKEKEKAASESLLKRKIILFVSVLALVMVVAYIFVVFIPLGYFARQSSRLNREWTALQKEFSPIESVIDKEKKLSSRETTLKSQNIGKPIWSMILSAISAATPSNVQLTSIKNESSQEFVNEKVTIVEGGKKVEREQRNIKINKVLVISGRYAAGKKGDDAIETFLKSLKESKIFIALFDKTELISYASIEGDMKSFSIKCWFKEEEKKEKKERGKEQAKGNK